MEKQEGLCVSIYMPTHHKGSETQQNQIRYKNLLRVTEEKLTASDLRPQEAKELLKPAIDLISDVPFWQNQSDCLAVFLSPLSFTFYRLPMQYDELVVVSDRFHIKPLIPAFSDNPEFYVLAICQSSVRLIDCSRYSAEEVELQGVPDNLDEALNLDEFEKHRQRHTGSEPTKKKILQYLKQVDVGLRELLKDKKMPLIFAGVDYLFPIYREANTYPYLAERGISGNPRGLVAEELRDLGIQLVDPLFTKEKTNAIEQYRQYLGTGRASTDVKEIVQASHHGRIGTLFVAVGTQQWGTFNPTTHEVVLEKKSRMGNIDLLDFAAVQTISSGGTVYAMKKSDIPDNAFMAALFRY